MRESRGDDDERLRCSQVEHNNIILFARSVQASSFFLLHNIADEHPSETTASRFDRKHGGFQSFDITRKL